MSSVYIIYKKEEEEGVSSHLKLKHELQSPRYIFMAIRPWIKVEMEATINEVPLQLWT